MRKVEGVEKVTVSLKDGLTTLELTPGNSVTLETLRTIIKNNGFVSRDADITATGRRVSGGTFEVAGTREQLPIAKVLSDAPKKLRFVSPVKK